MVSAPVQVKIMSTDSAPHQVDFFFRLWIKIRVMVWVGVGVREKVRVWMRFLTQTQTLTQTLTLTLKVTFSEAINKSTLSSPEP